MRRNTTNAWVWLFGALVALAGCSSGGGTPTDAGSAKPLPGHVYNWAGTGQAGYGPTGLPPLKTELYWPQDVVIAPDGTPYVLDWNNHRVIALDSSGHFKLIVGVATGDFGDPCPGGGLPCTNLLATDAKLNHPTDVAFDPANGDIILCAWHNSELFRVHPQTGLMDRICGDGSRGYNGDDQPAAQAITDLPVCALFDQNGDLVFADQANQIIRRIDEQGVIHRIAGTPPSFNGTAWVKQPGFDGDGGPATAAHFWFEVGQVADPSGRICYDSNWNLYISDSVNNCIRIIDPSGTINTFAGNHDLGRGYSGDGGPATQAQLDSPRDVAADAKGNLYIADTGNSVIRMVSPTGIITTVAGKYHGSGPNTPPISVSELHAEGGAPAQEIYLTNPYGVAVDSRGRVWIADTDDHAVRILYR